MVLICKIDGRIEVEEYRDERLVSAVGAAFQTAMTRAAIADWKRMNRPTRADRRTPLASSPMDITLRKRSSLWLNAYSSFRRFGACSARRSAMMP